MLIYITRICKCSDGALRSKSTSKCKTGARQLRRCESDIEADVDAYMLPHDAERQEDNNIIL